MKIAFVDVDDTLTEPASDEVSPERLAALRTLRDRGYEIVLFTARPPGGTWVAEFVRQRVPFLGVLQKPLADEGFIVVDDMCLGSYTSILDAARRAT